MNNPQPLLKAPMDQTAFDSPAARKTLAKPRAGVFRQPVDALHQPCSSGRVRLLRLLAEDEIHLRLPGPGLQRRPLSRLLRRRELRRFRARRLLFTTSSLPRWTTPATPTCWSSATAASQVALSNDATADWFKQRGGQLLPAGVQLQREHGLHRRAFAPDESPRRRLHHQCRRFFRPAGDRGGENDPAGSGRRAEPIRVEALLAIAAQADLRRASPSFAGASS